MQSKLVKQTLDQAGLDNKAATPTTLPISPTGDAGGRRAESATPNLKPDLGGQLTSGRMPDKITMQADGVAVGSRRARSSRTSKATAPASTSGRPRSW